MRAGSQPEIEAASSVESLEQGPEAWQPALPPRDCPLNFSIRDACRVVAAVLLSPRGGGTKQIYMAESIRGQYHPPHLQEF
jgi:hypothetical protein